MLLKKRKPMFRCFNSEEGGAGGGTATKESDSQSVSIEEHKAVVAKLEKLEKIYEERQTKALKKEDVLKKDELLKALGLEKQENKSEIELISEKLNSTNQTISELQAKLENAEKEKARMELEREFSDALEKKGFQKKALKLVDLSGDLTQQIEMLEAEYPELKVKTPVGTGSNPPIKNSVISNPYKRELWNLTLQSKLERENPALANKLKAEAGK